MKGEEGRPTQEAAADLGDAVYELEEDVKRALRVFAD